MMRVLRFLWRSWRAIACGRCPDCGRPVWRLKCNHSGQWREVEF